MKIDHLSHSKESMLANCGQQFAFVYGEGLVRPPGIALIRGRGPHKALEVDLVHVIQNGEPAPLEQVEDACADTLRREFQGEVMLDGEYQEMTKSEARKVVELEALAISRAVHENLVPSMRPAAVEIKVEAEVEGLDVPYVGVIDVAETVDGGAVSDLKTARKAPSYDTADTSEQLTAYRILYRAWAGQSPERLSLNYGWRTPAKGDVKTRTLETTRTDEDELVKVRRSQAALKVIDSENFLPAPVDHWICSPKYCGYTDVCPYYRGRPRPTT